MDKFPVSLNLTSFSFDGSTRLGLRVGSKIPSSRQSRGNQLVCPNINQDNHGYHEDRYPCKDGVISDHLACGTRRSPLNLHARHDSVLHHRRLAKVAHKSRATTVILMILPSTTHKLIGHPTLVPAATITANADSGAATTQMASATLTPPVLSEVEKVSIYGASNLSTLDQIFNRNNIKFGLSLLLLVLVSIMLMILIWREWDVRRAEERAANECAALVGGAPAQWRKLVLARRNTELRMALESRLLEQKNQQSRSGTWERNSQYSEPLASPFLT
ncbi:hypothetical protein K3495_g13482 [Podosphaera aphanis]|nr:hypothetical protein K3495_g13482 [Podosphaera aphanis]